MRHTPMRCMLHETHVHETQAHQTHAHEMHDVGNFSFVPKLPLCPAIRAGKLGKAESLGFFGFPGAETLSLVRLFLECIVCCV